MIKEKQKPPRKIKECGRGGRSAAQLGDHLFMIMVGIFRKLQISQDGFFTHPIYSEAGR